MSTKMKVLLVRDVDKLGSAGDIKDVSGGFGRNYLIPQGLAVLATRGQIKQSEERVAAQRKRDMVARKDAEAVAARFNGQTIRFTARVGEQDRLYGSVTSAEIAARLAVLAGTEIDRRKIELGEPIKRVGHFPITVRLMSGVEPIINVIVEGEEGSIQLPVDPEAE